MSENDGLKSATELVGRGGERAAPSAEALVPELRSNIKWKPSPNPPGAFRSEATVMIVWSYGVPFKDIADFHDWLSANEVQLDNLCQAATSGNVQYLGTYLHIDTGAPRYQTYWGLLTEAAEGTLAGALGNLPSQQQLFDLITELRKHWTRDPSATDHRYGQARNYADPGNLPSGGAFWNVTLSAANA
jgi:hypothetical protein